MTISCIDISPQNIHSSKLHPIKNVPSMLRYYNTYFDRFFAILFYWYYHGPVNYADIYVLKALLMFSWYSQDSKNDRHEIPLPLNANINMEILVQFKCLLSSAHLKFFCLPLSVVSTHYKHMRRSLVIPLWYYCNSEFFRPKQKKSVYLTHSPFIQLPVQVSKLDRYNKLAKSKSSTQDQYLNYPILML